MSKLTAKIRRASKQRAAAEELKQLHPELDVIVPPAKTRITAREVAEDFLRPDRHNKMKSRRRKLDLSQSELATVLDVDVTSIHRHERCEVLPALWDYALKGVEAEAADPATRQTLREYRSHLDRRDVFSEWKFAENSRLTAVRMVGAKRDSARAGRLKRKVQHAERQAGKATIVDLPKRP